MIETAFIIGLILIIFNILYYLSNKTLIPYTILLLIFGFFTKGFFNFFQIHFDINFKSEFIYSILLPFLLFASAIRINIHQFRLQFKTISFLATFGLMISITIIGGLLALFFNWRFVDGLLFGAIISSTDPISVLALFRSLGGPKRLALIIEGESMFNDATAVIVFRIILAMAVSQFNLNHLVLFSSINSFIYVFFGSIIFGAIFGYIVSYFLNKIKNSLIIETTLTIGVVLFCFSFVEHYLHLSGVIASVVFALVIGNLAALRSPSIVSHFVLEFWDYISHLSISFIFFFIAFNLDIEFLFKNYIISLIVIGIVLLARSIAVYLSFYITNKHFLFSDEPNVPFSWQHILNWGGLRGIIPLVLVYSLPDSYLKKQTMIDLTLAVMIFSLFINGSTIIFLLKKLKLNMLSYIEKIRNLHDELFYYDEAINFLEKGNSLNISQESINVQLETWKKKEKEIIENFKRVNLKEYKKALSLECLIIEKKTYEDLLSSSELNEGAFYELDSQLDLQWDAIEYPDIKTSLTDKTGKIKSKLMFRQRILRIRQIIANFPRLCKILGINKDYFYYERYMLVRARLIGSNQVLIFLNKLKENFYHLDISFLIDELIKKYQFFIKKADKEIKELRKNINIRPLELKISSHALKKYKTDWIM